MKMIVIVSSLALFEIVAATGNSGTQDWEQRKVGFFNGNDVHSWCQSTPSLALALKFNDLLEFCGSGLTMGELEGAFPGVWQQGLGLD
jgi:hypothetical protein